MESSHLNAHSPEYKAVRAMFDGLGLEDKALFLIEATFSTAGQAFEQAGRVLFEEVDRLFNQRPPAAEPADAAAEPTI